MITVNITKSARESEESRLRKRLHKLNLDMKEIRGDGNCQFRAVSFCLYGSEDYHPAVRRAAVSYMRCACLALGLWI